MANAIKRKRGILDLIDTPAISYVASEIGNNIVVCDGSMILGFGYMGVGAPKSWGGVPVMEG